MKAGDATFYNSGYSNYYNWKDTSTYHYFKYEPIKWRVLNRKGNDALLLADIALDDQQYNMNYRSVTWETSSVRSWLNGYGASVNQPKTDYSRKNFINSAFTSAQRSAIKKTNVVNDDNIYHGTTGGKNTSDKVFLLSDSEVYSTDTAAGYGFVKNYSIYDEARRSRYSTYAYAMGACRNNIYTSYRENICWWLRSPGGYSHDAAEVSSSGWVDRYGNFVDENKDGVRPALHLNLSSTNLYSYAGTVCSDEMKSGERQKQTNYSWDEASGTLTVTGSCDMEDYSASSPAPWAGYRNKIKKVIVESGVTGIGSYAFENCKNLSSVEIGNTVQKIGEGAFSNCLTLKSVTIPSSVDTIAYGAFWWCPDLDTVYFEGNAPEMGEEIFHNMSLTAYYVANDKTWTSAKRGNYGGHVTWKTWYGNREEGSIYVDPMNLGEISVNNKGKGYSWYTLTDVKGSPITNTEIEYTIGSTCKTTKTNARGEFAVVSPTVTKDTEFTVKITTKDARPLKNASQSFSVKVTTLSYSSEYTLSNSITGGGTLTTPIVGGGGESEVGGRSIIKYQTDDKGTHFTFQQAMDSDALEIKEGQYYTLAAVKGTRNAQYVPNLTDAETICAVKAQQAMKTQSGTAAINFGIMNIAKEKAVSFYLIGAGKVQYIQSFSGTGEEICEHKNIVTDPRKEPTCTETGLTEGSHCGDCNAVLVEQKVIPATGHKEVIDPAVAPTETTPGKTEGKHCSVCNAILVAQKEIPPTGKTPTDNTGSDTNTSTEDTTKPDGKGDTKPAEDPKPSTKPAENPKPSQKPTTNPKASTKPAGSTLLKVGTQVTDKKTGAVYKVNGIRTVEYKKSLKKTSSIVIPSIVNIKGVKYQVTSIAPKAFMNNKKLKKVVISATIRSIGKQAFAGCKNLKKITVKTPYLTKKSVGAKAFKGIYAKAVIKVPKKQKKAYSSLFKAKGTGKKVKIK